MPKIDIVNAKNIIESNPEKAFFKLKNTGGPKGDTGAQGPQGPKGDTGAQGPAGASASVTVGSTTTLSPGADATVTNSGDTRNAILNFGIPTGARGPKGDTGSKGDTGPMGPKGAKGDTGAAATVQVGNTNTGAPGTNAQVTNAGNEHFAVFNFTIPRGDKGEKGSTGPQGPKGDTGAQGPQGIQGPKGDTGSVKSDVVAELPETGEEDTFYLVNREATEQTATGKAINFTNSDNAGDITDFQLDGETSQNGTPTPDAPVAVQTVTGENVVKICGKNLFNNSQSATLELGATASATSTGIRITKKSGAGAWSGCAFALFRASDYAGQVIRFSATATPSSTNSPYCAIIACDKDGKNRQNLIAIIDGQTDVKLTTTIPSNLAANKYIGLTINASGATAGDAGAYTDYTNAMLTIGDSSYQDYEPYQGQSYEVNLGKNLFDKDKTPDNYYYNNSGTTTSDGQNTFVNQEFNGITKMAISWSSRSGASAYVRVCEYKADGTFIKRTLVSTNDTILTMDANTWKVITSVDVGPNFSFTDLQIERGDSITDYAAYFTPIELCKIAPNASYVFEDYIYKSGDKWYKHKAVGKQIVDTSEITLASNYSNIEYAKIPKPTDFRGYNNYINNPFLCSHATYEYTIPSGWDSSDNIGKIYPTAGALQNWVGFAKGSGLDAIKTALTGCTIYYALATPTDTEITNQALITQLDNVASAPLYTGVNNITTITPNEQGTLEIKYVTYEKYNRNKVYIWNDSLQQWQIIVQ